MKSILGLFFLPLMALCGMAYRLDGSLYGALQRASAPPLSLMANMASASPTALINSAASMAPFLLPQTYPSPYELSMPYNHKIPPFMPPASPFMSGHMPHFPSPYAPQSMPFMPSASPCMSGNMPHFAAPYRPQRMPFMPPASPFMPGYVPQLPAPYGPQARPCLSIALPTASYPAPYSVMSPLMKYNSDDPLASSLLTNQKAVSDVPAAIHAYV